MIKKIFSLGLIAMLLVSNNVYSKKIVRETKVLISTSYGDMTVLLYNETPQHRDNFIKLVNDKFYNETLFHRVIEGFMIQGGDPESKNAEKDAQLGNGGPGYTVPAEFNENLIHKKGALCAARTGDHINPEKASSGSQFYIVQGRKIDRKSLENIAKRKNRVYSEHYQIKEYQNNGGTPQLDMDYTVFGEVIKGLNVIDKIAAVAKGSGDRPIKDIKMTMKIVK